jgi:hypothetical protein
MIAGTTLNGVEAWLNSTSVGTTTRTTGAATGQDGIANLNEAFYANCNIQEVIYYASDKSTDRTDIEGNISAYFQSAKLLDESFGSGAEAAYSTRQLRRDQTDCMVIRRASDSTTTTIGFVDGDIDEAAIETFCTGTTCTVQTWKDQSGNGNDATAAAPANEPTIYTGGALVKENGSLALDFDTTDVLIASSITINGQRSDFAVVTIDDITRENGIFNTDSVNDGTTTTDRYAQNIKLDLSTGVTTNMRNLSFTSGGAVKQIQSNGVQQGVRHLLNGQYSGTTLSGYIDGVAKGSTTQIDQKTGTSHLAIGSAYQATRNLLDGKIQELITFQSDKGSVRTSIESNIGDYFTQNTPLLDTYSGAAAAYSLRLLDSTYTGALINVWNGTSYADIYPNVFGELDTVALAAHCGSNDGFIRYWYDQSSNSNDATQTATASMPKIYDGTTGVITENGKPAVMFETGQGAPHMNITSITPRSQFAVVKTSNAEQNSGILEPENPVFHYANNGNLKVHRVTISIGASNPLDQKLVSSIADGASSQHHVNDESSTTTVSTYYSGSTFGGRSAQSNRQCVPLQEYVAYATVVSGSYYTGIRDNINTFYNIY